MANGLGVYSPTEIDSQVTDPRHLVPIPEQFQYMSALPVEHAVASLHGATGKLLRVVTAGVGDGESTKTDFNLILAAALSAGARTIVFAHNHPRDALAGNARNLFSSDADPDIALRSSLSAQDVKATSSQIAVLARYLPGVTLTDSLVIGQRNAFSIRRWIEAQGFNWRLGTL